MANEYGYEASPVGLYRVSRDGKTVLPSATEQEAWKYLHGVLPCSISHAVKHEGWRIEPLQEAP